LADYKQVLKQYGQIGENPQARGYFGILATLTLLIVLLLLIFPAIRHVTQINKEITDAREVVAKLETKLADLEQARINLEEVKADLPLLDGALPVGSDMPKHFVTIDSLSQKHKLKIFSVQFTDVPLSKPSIQESELETRNFVYSVTFEGAFPRFRNFLSDLEHLIRISNVGSINILKEEDTPLRLTVGVSSYFLGTSPVSPEDLGTPAGQADQQTSETQQQTPNEVNPGGLINE